MTGGLTWTEFDEIGVNSTLGLRDLYLTDFIIKLLIGSGGQEALRVSFIIESTNGAAKRWVKCTIVTQHTVIFSKRRKIKTIGLNPVLILLSCRLLNTLADHNL